MLEQNRQIGLDRTPDHGITDIQILVGEQISEINDLSPFWDRGKELWISLCDHLQGFPDDDEFTLDG